MEKLDCVISLTTWKGRIADPDTQLALYSLIKQKTKYKFKVILTLSKEEFPNQINELPENIKLLYENKIIDIIWADNNNKALKKLYPICTMYDCPILTTDDDIICKDSIVERFMEEHEKFPNMVLSEGGITVIGIPLTGGFRLFPKDSFLNIDPKYFREFFQTAEDDLYIAILMAIKGTPLKYVHSGLMMEIPRKMKDATALRRTYCRINRTACKTNLINQLKKDKII